MESSASAGRVASAVLDPRRWWALALVLLVYTVVEAPGADWGDVRTSLPLADSAALVAAFALIESRHPAPLVQLRIFRSRTLAGAVALTILIGTVAVGIPRRLRRR